MSVHTQTQAQWSTSSLEPTTEGLGRCSVVEHLLGMHIILDSIPSATDSVSQSVN